MLTAKENPKDRATYNTIQRQWSAVPPEAAMKRFRESDKTGTHETRYSEMVEQLLESQSHLNQLQKSPVRKLLLFQRMQRSRTR